MPDIRILVWLVVGVVVGVAVGVAVGMVRGNAVKGIVGNDGKKSPPPTTGKRFIAPVAGWRIMFVSKLNGFKIFKQSDKLLALLYPPIKRHPVSLHH